MLPVRPSSRDCGFPRQQNRNQSARFAHLLLRKLALGEPATNLLQFGVMDIQVILSELREHRSRLDAAIAALEKANGIKRRGRPGRKSGRHMSADARRRIGLAMKKRWAERKKASA